MKHTPGPWSMLTSSAGHHAVFASDQHGSQMIAGCHRKDPDDSVYLANAVLIAAAPDLLTALQVLVYGGLNKSHFDAAKAAIAKATGVTA